MHVSVSSLRLEQRSGKHGSRKNLIMMPSRPITEGQLSHYL